MTGPSYEAAQRANRVRYEEAEARQLERCEARLREEALLRRPDAVRCECGGIIRRGFAKHHHCA